MKKIIPLVLMAVVLLGTTACSSSSVSSESGTEENTVVVTEKVIERIAFSDRDKCMAHLLFTDGSTISRIWSSDFVSDLYLAQKGDTVVIKGRILVRGKDVEIMGVKFVMSK